MKKFLALLLGVCMAFSTVWFTACEINIFNGNEKENASNSGDKGNIDADEEIDETEKVEQVVQRENGESVPTFNLVQKAIKNDDFLDTEVSWHDNEYNYYVFNVGKIKNIPLTSSYASFGYGGATATFSKEITKATESSIKTSTSTAVTSAVKTTASGSVNVNSSVSVELKAIFKANVDRGFTISTTRETTNQTVWGSAYEECVNNAKSETNKVTLTFDSGCKVGNYLYLYLGSVNVYYTIIQSRKNPSIYYSEIYNSVYNYKYALVYTGDDDEFPIDTREKIEIDPSFVTSLKTPTEYIEGVLPETNYETKTITYTWLEKVTVKKSEKWMLEISNFDKYHSQGYNKIKIEYKFYTTGGWALLGGNVDINGYVSTSESTADNIHNFCKPSSEDGKWIDGNVVADLIWFKNSKTVYMIMNHNNLTENFTVSKLTLTLKIYHE